MANPEHPQIYLITPNTFELSRFNSDLAALLDAFDIACVRLRLATENTDEIGRTADLLRETCHGREVPLVIENHSRLVDPHGLDGVHLTDGARQVRDLRKSLESEAIIGSFCENSRHAGLSAGEAGADYIAFGPVVEHPLFANYPVDTGTLEWWSQMVELPVVAEGGLTLDLAETLAPHADFFALGSEVWDQEESPAKTLAAYLDRIQ